MLNLEQFDDIQKKKDIKFCIDMNVNCIRHEFEQYSAPYHYLADLSSELHEFILGTLLNDSFISPVSVDDLNKRYCILDHIPKRITGIVVIEDTIIVLPQRSYADIYEWIGDLQREFIMWTMPYQWDILKKVDEWLRTEEGSGNKNYAFMHCGLATIYSILKTCRSISRVENVAMLSSLVSEAFIPKMPELFNL